MQKILLFLCLVISLAGISVSQVVDSQQISGIVLDPSGAAVPRAEIAVINEATGLSRSVKSNDNGNYVVLNLPVGVYTITTTIAGFKKSVLSGVHVDVGSKPSVPIQLEVGQATESVEVQAGVVMMQTTSAEIGSVVTSEEATQIQLNGRNYIQLMTLAPGVSQTVASGFALFGTYGVSGSGQSVNGIRTDSMNYFIDGVDNKDNGGGGNNFVNISPDALQQFRSTSSSYDASYGGTSGATVSVAVRSGGRDFHGNAYEYFRNDAIQGYPFIPINSAVVKPPLRYNNFGYTIGGPIYIPGHFNQSKEKLFFFFAQDFKRLRVSTISTPSVPTPAALNAALAGSTTATGRALAATLLTSPTGTYTYLNRTPSDQQEYLIKVDYNASQKDHINGFYVHDFYSSLGNPTNYITFQRRLPGLISSVQWTHTFNEKTVNVLTGSFSGNIILQTNGIGSNPQFGNKAILRSDYGLTYATLFNASQYIPQITVTGYSGISVTPLNFNNYQRIYAAKDDFSRLIGNHSLKMGGYIWRGRKNQTAPPALNGQFTFASLANLVQGNFSNYTEGSNVPQVQARFSQIETYLQDDWTATRRLTLNLGLRWQYMQPIYSWANNASAFRPAYYDPSKAATINPANGLISNSPSPYNGLVLPGTHFPSKASAVVPTAVLNNPQVLALFHGLPNGLVNTYWTAFAPRVGFAWDVNGKQETVLHGGYGMAYERVEGNYYYGSVSQLPFTAVASLTSTGNADNLGSVGVTSAPTNISNSPDPNLAPPRIHNYSLGIQQKVTNNTTFELNYVGSRSTNLTWIRNLNQAVAGTEQANPGIARNALRPYKGYAEIYQYTNGVHANYNSLQTRLLTRFSKGGNVNLTFTWSSALTQGSAYNYSPQDSSDLAADYGPANFNQPKIFVASYVYPFQYWLRDHEWYKKILSGWQVSGITRIASGLPINVIQPLGQSVAGNLVTTSAVAQRPNLVGNPYAHNGKQYLNYAAFAVPGSGTYGNLGYDAIHGPLFHNWDAALQKNIPITEQIGIEFRAEMFNAPNHMSFFTVANTLGSPQAGGTYQPNFNSTGFQNNFGQVTAATDPRTMEFVLRVHF